MGWSRRHVLQAGMAGLACPVAVSSAACPEAQSRVAPAASVAGLRPLTNGIRPIARAEREARLEKLRGLMQQARVSALLVEPGATLHYFTGIRWQRSERTTAAVIPVRGAVVIVTPAFEEPSVRESLQVGGEVRVWNEDDSPFALLADALRTARGRGPVAAEATTRFFVLDGVRRAGAGIEWVPGDPLVRPCRTIKSDAELELMQVANSVTIAALRHVHAHVQAGMRSSELAALMDAATRALGGEPEFALVLLNEASAYPHGSRRPQSVRPGSVILMDCGCTVEGYQSDISRSWIFGEPSARQRKVWNTVKRGQEIALETARLGRPVGQIDDAVRAHYVREGWGPGYRLPGLPHRTGHGIGLEGHEPAYLVHGDPTPLEVGMCFSDEPGLYIPGEFGIRLEDCWHMSSTGPRLFTGLAASIDVPI